MDVQNPIVTMELETGEKIVIELYPDKAPNTVANFVCLVKEGFYDGVVFHRAVPDFVIQGGDPTGTGMGGPGYCIAGEFAANGYPANDICHVRGTISMARSQTYNSAGSQFFICVSDKYGPGSLDGLYAGFGMVTSGMQAVDAIVSAPTRSQSLLSPIAIKAATVETFGVDYQVKKFEA